MTYVYSAEQLYVQGCQAAVDASQELFDFTYKRGMAGEPWPLLTRDQHQLQLFFNKVKAEAGWTENYINNMEERLPRAERLLVFLQKEYDLD